MLIITTVALAALALFCAIPLAFALLAGLIVARFIGRR